MQVESLWSLRNNFMNCLGAVAGSILGVEERSIDVRLAQVLNVVKNCHEEALQNTSS